MQITVQDSQEGGLLRLHIRASAERVDAAREVILDHLRSTTEFQGFRNKAKVPEDMIVRAGGGQQNFDLTVVEELMNSAMTEVRSCCLRAPASKIRSLTCRIWQSTCMHWQLIVVPAPRCHARPSTASFTVSEFHSSRATGVLCNVAPSNCACELYVRFPYVLLPPQAFKPYEPVAIESSLAIDSDPKDLLATYKAGEAFEFAASAELGDIGLEFTQPYKGLDVEVNAVLNQQEEDLRCHRAIQLCAARPDPEHS